MKKELVKVLKKHRFFELRKEIWYNEQDPKDTGTIMVSAYSTKDGGYIGGRDTAYYLVFKRGIWPQKSRPDSYSCSIGFCFKENKWYGWSHRAIFGFGIGSTVKKGDCAYNPSTVDELYDELTLVPSYPGNNGSQFPSDENPDEVPVLVRREDTSCQYIKQENGIMCEEFMVRFETMSMQPSKEILDKIAAHLGLNTTREDNNLDCVEYDAKHPLKNLPSELAEYEGLVYRIFENSATIGKWSPAESHFHFIPLGKGEWTAVTFDDAKEMACDFAESVS